jgi:lipoprotein LpqH
MQNRLFGVAAVLAAGVMTSGCGLTGTPASEPSMKSGRITVGDRTQDTQSVACTQNQWDLTIDASADPGRAQVFLQLGGQTPDVRTVNIENIDGLSGVSGGDVGQAEASTKGSSNYVITGTAVVSDVASPGQTKTMPFKIEAPC